MCTVCCTEGFLTPNRCHYFPLASSHLSMSAAVFSLFHLCYFVCVLAYLDESAGEEEWGGRGLFCVCPCVGVCATKTRVAQKVTDTFWWARLEICGKSNFQLNFIEWRSYGASSVTAPRESVQVTGTNTIFHLVQERAFELTLYGGVTVYPTVAGTGLVCWRVGWASPLEKRNDTINYISEKLAEGVKSAFCECGMKAAGRCRAAVGNHRERGPISTTDSTVLKAPWPQVSSLNIIRCWTKLVHADWFQGY